MEQSIVNLEFKPEIFDPNKDTLNKVKDEVAKITADPTKITKEELETVSETRKTLVKYRTGIKARGKEARDGAIKFQKDVIAYEKELIEIIEPEEKRLKEIEDEAKKHAMRQARLETLPEYKEKLLSINGTMPNSPKCIDENKWPITDEELLDMDPTQFQEFYNDCREEHFNTLEQERIEREAKEAEEKAAEEAAKKAEQERIDREKEQLAKDRFNNRVQILLGLGMQEFGLSYVYGNNINIPTSYIKDYNDEEFNTALDTLKESIAKAKEAEAKKEAERVEREKAEAVQKAKEETEAKARAEKEAEEKARQEKEERERKEKEEAEQKAAEEKAEREQAEAYQKWLSDNSYNAETDIVHETSPGTFILYREVSKYTEKKPVVE